MRYIKKLGVPIITVILILGMLTSNLTFVVAESSDYSVDIADLEALYNERKDIQRGTYTHGSWEYFQDALQLAKWVLDDRDEVDDETIEWSYDYLSSAMLTEEDEHDGTQPDLSILESTYNQYKDVKQENYNQISWKDFQDSLKEAYSMLYEYEYITQHNVDLTLEFLETSYADLEEGEPDIEQLEAAYNKYKDVKQGNFNQGSWAWFKQKRKYIKGILENKSERESLTQKEIDYLIEDLVESFNHLETGKADLTELEKAFKQFKDEYGDIDPNKVFTDADDIELYETMMYHIPIFLTDIEDATQREADELILSLKELERKIENPNGEDGKPEIEDNGENEKDESPKDDAEQEKNEITKNENEKKDDGSSKDEDKKEEDESSKDKDKKEKEESSKNEDEKGKSSQTNSDGDELTPPASGDNDSKYNAFKEKVQKHVLPDTATEYYNTIILGVIITVVGTFLYIYYSALSFLRRRFNLF